MPGTKRAVADLIGTFWLVFGGRGSAVPSADKPAAGAGEGEKAAAAPKS